MSKRTKSWSPHNSDFPTYGNPHPNGVLAEWVRGRGWVVDSKPKRKLSKRKPKVVMMGWCAQCGPLSAAALDEDGCCAVCGADATGPGADKALRLLKRADPHAKLKADVVRAAVALVERRLTYTRFLEVVSKLQKVKP